MDPKKPRKGKPLLLATVGLATVSFVACEPGPSQPVGNLRAHDPEPTMQPEGVPLEVAADVDASTPAPDAGTGAPDAGSGASDAGADAGRGGFTLKPLPPYPNHPVGNLRPPPQRPVGNQRAPSSN